MPAWNKSVSTTMSVKSLSNLMAKFHFREVIAFGFVGGLATVTHYVCAIISNELLSIELYLANIIGYLCAVGVSFIGHSKLTFQQNMNQALFRRFCIMSVATFALSELLLCYLESGLMLPTRIVMLIVVVTIPVISYLLNKFWVFQR